MPILTTLSKLAEEKKTPLQDWFSAKRAQHAPHITSSVDLRHDGLRLVPVDTNIYPAGFQNLSARGVERAAFHFASGIESIKPRTKNILIAPESHTRNLPYLDNLNALQTILTKAGFRVEIGSLVAEDNEIASLAMANGNVLEKQPLVVKDQLLQTQSGFIPDVILLNNDGTSGISTLLQHIRQPIIPSPDYGWFIRKKSCHFKAYQSLIDDFAEHVGLDAWLLSAYFAYARNVDFKERKGVDQLAETVDALVEKIKIKHQQYGISEDPYIYIKADSGTYGMGIMTVRDGSELLEMNKKQRNKMHVIKEGAEVHDVIIQEGIKTIDTVEGKAAEPMVYLVDGVPVGGMFRVNSSRDAYGNLNAAGMEYVGMCDEGEVGNNIHQVAGCDFAAYGMIAAISALAAGAENYSENTAVRAQECA